MRPFLMATGAVALAVGTLALAFPLDLLASKGATATPAVVLWVRQVGVLLVALGVMSFLMRHERPSPALRAFLVGNAVVQAGLFPLELLAWREGTLTVLAGLVPNTVLHAVLGSAFGVLAWRMRSVR